MNQTTKDLIYRSNVHWRTAPKEDIRVLDKKNRLLGTISFKSGGASFEEVAIARTPSRPSKKKQKQNSRWNRHDFLLTLFDDNKQKYAEKEVNGYWLVRQWNSYANRWQVAVYPPGKLKRKGGD